ncbi:MAG TPA: hypothetical protein VEA79_00435 [Phenylobacterium sp.]|nr:hypothetical protein [Phenylobacterium sp.]
MRKLAITMGATLIRLAGLALAASAPAAQTEQLEAAVDAPLLPDKPSVGMPLSDWFGATQCDINENVAWSCKAGGKVISVCASDPVSGDEGYIQYRIGRPPRTELVYPARKVPPRGKFAFRLTPQGDVALSFSNGGYDYEVYDILRSEEDGVIVSKGGKEVAHIRCNGGGTGMQIVRPDLLGIAGSPYGN